MFSGQMAEDGKRLNLTHERAAFHAPVVCVIAPSNSSSQDRGIYEYSLENPNEHRLISDGPNDRHVNVSQDGKYTIFNSGIDKKAVMLELDENKLKDFLNNKPKEFNAPTNILVGQSLNSNGVSLNLQAMGSSYVRLIARDRQGKHLWKLPDIQADCQTKQCRLAFQTDGNLVLYQVNSTRPWHFGIRALRSIR